MESTKTQKIQSPESGNWKVFLRALPIRNVAAEELKEDIYSVDEVVLRVRMKKTKWLIPHWLVPTRSSRRVRLTGIGITIWQQCNGQRCVEEIVDLLASEESLSFHEARVSVTQYLRQLVESGVLVLSIPKEARAT